MPDPEFELENFLPYLLNQAAEASSLAFQQVYKKRYGMLRTEWRVLFHLGVYGQLTASDIGARARMHKTKISRAVHRLTERRFIERVTDKADRRVAHLTLTAQGRAAYDDLRSVAQTYERNLLAQLAPEEVGALRQALLKLSGAAPQDFT
ncbi:Transcriptional regulator, MarR family protein [Sulfitobacter noctilucae]|uniref:MarR family winged helix-turn-helix transcriptional regulator n=1 Tax=Sulfitobacter noctilucae TaxID=1342302 RepID=UPI000468B607|nr:MarR family transcriptional regulator [Sulfitobacter noctilucae]KIN65330.1 Transcriptional regulator, MarR family protein [Sulfitobacter noctilucae]